VSRFTSMATGWTVAISITLGMLEIGLRALPGAIPLGFLKKFEPGTRLEIAQRRGLPNLSQVWVLPRDDDGPELRLFKPFTASKLRYIDEGAEVAVDFDANGFCNPLPDGGYAAPKIDIMAIGDSFTACVAVAPEATWSHQLSDILGRSSYNLGRGGVGTYEYIQIFKRFGLEKNPDVVVLNIYEGNDLRDAIRYWTHADPSRRGDVADLDRRTRAPVDNVLGRHSYVFNLVAVALAKGWKAGEQALDRARGRPGPQDFDFRYHIRLADGDVLFNDANYDNDEIDYALAVLDGRVDLDVFDAALQSFVELADEHGFQPVVSYSPSAHTVYKESIVFEEPDVEAPLAQYSQALRNYLTRAADEFGFLFVDATAAMQAAADGSRRADLLYFPTNLHFTPAGHRLLAEQIAEALAETPGRS
jgi:hypothetical protein